MRTINMARYELVKQDIGKSPRLKVTLLDIDGSTIAEGYLIIYRRYCFQIVGENSYGDLGSTPVMNLYNFVNLPNKYQASILINMMARNTIYEFVKNVLTDAADIQANNINFYDICNYNTLGKFTEECLYYLFGDFNKLNLNMTNNYTYHDEYVRYSK